MRVPRLVAIVLFCSMAAPVRSAEEVTAVTRLKDLVTLEGVRENQLIGYGLVVGLAGTGDRQQTVFSTQSLANLLQRMGVVVDPTAIQVKNTAAVMVTGNLPAFAQPGAHIDVTASSVGDARTLQGGLLLLTALKGLETLVVSVDRVARVVVNERTGTIVLGKDVRIGPVAILQGNLTVEIQTTFAVSQPGPLSTGTTQVVPETTVDVKQEKARNVVLKQGATVEELVRALTAIGATARDVIAILQNLHAAGALEADLEVI